MPTYTQAQLDEIRAKLAEGMSRGRTADGREVEFDLAALREQERIIAAALAADAQRPTVSRIRMATSRGCW